MTADAAPDADRAPSGRVSSGRESSGRGRDAALSHLDARGRARMVDVSGKAVTVREAVATGFVSTTPEVVALVRDDAVPKGDVLAVARIAGIQAAKRTPELVPLAHVVALHAVSVDVEVEDAGLRITARTRTAERTGVEMEALVAVAAAGLAVIDMIKAVDRGAVLGDVRVEEKSGGRSGTWRRGAGS